ncbi:MAG: hypothetical protein ACYC0E_15245, partial [Acidimicrobiales bacterium]
EGAAVNLWGVTPDAVALQAEHSEVTWGGPTPAAGAGSAGAEGALAALVPELAEAGATWAVFGWPVPLEALAAAGATATRRRRLPPPGAAGSSLV